uniref:Uncharacterized protein n=1 Tax=Ananas comosus var. bracteatus TaxID=296719 RepID=A0A6V7PBY9_ANACO|nr:unnamed protein product [Ananas comosus var. bracteatus]
MIRKRFECNWTILGAGVGKTIIAMGFINNIAKAHGGLMYLAEWENNLAEFEVVLIYGQMNEPSGARMRVSLTWQNISGMLMNKICFYSLTIPFVLSKQAFINL